MNADTVAQGLTITVVGMGLVFLVLGLLVLAMLLMGRLLRPRPARPASPAPGAPAAPARPDRGRVAVMAAAIALSLAARQPRPAGGWARVEEGQALGPWQRHDLARPQEPLREGDACP